MNRGDGSIFNADGLQMYIDYGARTDGQPVYLGYAVPGQTTADIGWQISFFTYVTIGTSGDYVATKQIATRVAWVDRALTSTIYR